MIVVIRRVRSASVSVEGSIVSSIRHGLLLYVGLEKGDSEKHCQEAAAKISKLRLFDGPESEINVTEAGGSVLSVSQFTLSADTKKGNRPSFTRAMPSSEAHPLFQFFNEALETQLNAPVATGVFGADMLIFAEDDGPYTIILNSAQQ